MVEQLVPRQRRVYLEEEVGAMMVVFAEHQKKLAYYQADHIETRDWLYRADQARPRSRRDRESRGGGGAPERRRQSRRYASVSSKAWEASLA